MQTDYASCQPCIDISFNEQVTKTLSDEGLSSIQLSLTVSRISTLDMSGNRKPI